MTRPSSRDDLFDVRVPAVLQQQFAITKERGQVVGIDGNSAREVVEGARDLSIGVQEIRHLVKMSARFDSRGDLLQSREGLAASAGSSQCHSQLILAGRV